MRTILVLYLKYYLQWDENTATAVYHAFTVLAYLSTLPGAIIADSLWGKYHTILWLSIVYAIGMIVNTLGAIGTLGDLKIHTALSCIGLLVVAVGTGGIKPCVSTFGGDQFDISHVERRRQFFSVFYFSINAGSLLSTFLSPIMREDVQCFGDDCYALGFGMPAVLMIIAIILFLFGTKSYKRVPPAGNIFIKVCGVVKAAVRNRFKAPTSKINKKHWLDYAQDGSKATQLLIRDVKYVLNVLILFLPLPLFWALFDQQGSRWTLQAVRMNGYVGSFRILPDQMQICNPLLIIIFIPLFEATLYPCLRRLNLNFSPLRRIGTGMLLACLSFIVAALVQMMIDVNLTKVPYNDQEASLRIINSANCNLDIISNVYPDWNESNGNNRGIILSSGNHTDIAELFSRPGKYNVTYKCTDDIESISTTIVNLQGRMVHDLIISDNVSGLKTIFTRRQTEKSNSGRAIISLVNSFNQNVTFVVEFSPDGGKHTQVSYSLPPKAKVNVNKEQLRGRHHIHLKVDGMTFNRTYQVESGALYTIIARKNSSHKYNMSDEDLVLDVYTDIHYNDISILWIVPQYVIITLAEVFLSVTTIEFAYSQAPPSMKSLLNSFSLLTVAVGDFIVLLVAESRLIPSQMNPLLRSMMIVKVLRPKRRFMQRTLEILRNLSNSFSGALPRPLNPLLQAMKQRSVEEKQRSESICNRKKFRLTPNRG